MRKAFAEKAARERRIREACPGIPDGSGIYAFTRDDESGLRMAYVGQAASLCGRCAAHLGEYDHIGLSLRKRGFYSEGSPYGWKLSFRECPREELDRRERDAIRILAGWGYQLYNVTSGGQGAGKSDIGGRKPARGYRDGVAQGRRQLARELSGIIARHLEVRVRPGKEGNRISERALEKFWALIGEEGKKDG